MGGLRELLVAAFLLTLSLMLTIFACTLIADHNAWPLLPFAFYFFAPVPAFLCSKRSDSIMDSGSSSFDNFGHFLIGLCAASGPSMSLVQYHTGAITIGALFMSLGSAALLAAAVGVLMFSNSKQQDQFLS
jgi:hypothetical protein